MTRNESCSPLRLCLACGCTAAIERRESDERFVLAQFVRADACTVHGDVGPAGTEVRGFGPYPDWDANVAMRVQSLPEPGGMMEREHAFILDGQFVFLAEPNGPRPLGPIADAAWAEAGAAR